MEFSLRRGRECPRRKCRSDYGVGHKGCTFGENHCKFGYTHGPEDGVAHHGCKYGYSHGPDAGVGLGGCKYGYSHGPDAGVGHGGCKYGYSHGPDGGVGHGGWNPDDIVGHEGCFYRYLHGNDEGRHHGPEHDWKHEKNGDKCRGRRHQRRCGKNGAEEGHCRFEGWKSFPHFTDKICPHLAGKCCLYKKISSEDFKVSFDVKSFNPEEITVKIKGHEIFVDGKHDERADEYGFVSRQFSRKIILPDEFDTNTIATYSDEDGRMTIVASKPKPPVDESTERIIPIERVTRVQNEATDLLETTDTDKLDEDNE